MQVTVNTNESLDDVLRVIGAAFNVTLHVTAGVPAQGGASGETSGVATAATGRGRRGARGTGRKASGRTPGRKASARKAPQGRSPRRRTAAAASDSSQIREWARANGHSVSDRGRISSSIQDAYRAAHS